MWNSPPNKAKLADTLQAFQSSWPGAAGACCSGTCCSGFIRVLEILESPGILFWHFPGLEIPGKLMQVLESPGNLETLAIKFSFKTIFCSIIFGFLFCKGLLLQLLCIRESWKNLSES